MKEEFKALMKEDFIINNPLSNFLISNHKSSRRERERVLKNKHRNNT